MQAGPCMGRCMVWCMGVWGGGGGGGVVMCGGGGINAGVYDLDWWCWTWGLRAVLLVMVRKCLVWYHAVKWIIFTKFV